LIAAEDMDRVHGGMNEVCEGKLTITYRDIARLERTHAALADINICEMTDGDDTLPRSMLIKF
jgi:hypothetical protein